MRLFYIEIIKTKTKKSYKNIKQVLSSSWDGWPFGHNRHGPKIGGLCPLWGMGELVPI